MRKYNDKISERANETLSKREAVVRKQKVIVIIIFLLLISLGIFFGSSVDTFASSKTDVSSLNKYYTSVQIEYGDTVWDLADRYISHLNISKKAFIDEICLINHISGDDIRAGDYIVIPYYSDEIK